MDVSFHHNEQLIRPWRTAAFVAASVAAVELLVLVIIGGALIAKSSSATANRPVHKAAVAHTTAAKTTSRAPVAKPRRAAVPAARLARGRISVLVLNGNGRQGAAAATAARVSRRGYRVGGVANASSSDFTRSLVMYRRGFEGEGRRLAHDLGIPIVGPLDGMRAAQLHGAHAVVVIGA
ncbi:MAG: LytR C-terminal domain-containing protein [Thermoleophilia bacterium]